MSRKHFVLLAAALRLHRASCTSKLDCDDLIYSIACLCKGCNSNFNFDRFYTASNYKGADNASD